MPKNRTGVRGSQEPRAEAVGDAPDTAFSQNEFEGYFNQYNLEVSAERKKLYEVDAGSVLTRFVRIKFERTVDIGAGNLGQKLRNNQVVTIKANGSASSL
jgi:hypothetical protein